MFRAGYIPGKCSLVHLIWYQARKQRGKPIANLSSTTSYFHMDAQFGTGRLSQVDSRFTRACPSERCSPRDSTRTPGAHSDEPGLPAAAACWHPSREAPVEGEASPLGKEAFKQAVSNAARPPPP